MLPPLARDDTVEELAAQSMSESGGHIREVGSGPLAFYHCGIAVPMLKDYLQDLVVLNNQQLEGVAENVRQPPLDSMQRRIEEYRLALEEMREANEREPDG